MSDTTDPHSSPVGDERSPANVSDPAETALPGDAASATRVEQPVSRDTKPQEGDADRAFEAFQAERPDNQHTEQPPASDEQDAEKTATTHADAKAETPDEKKPAAEPAKAEDLAPTESEKKDGRVSVKKLERALRGRAEIRNQHETEVKSHAQTKGALNGILDQLADTTFEVAQMEELLSVSANARKGDPAAQQKILDLYGIKAPAAAQQEPEHSPEDIEEALLLAAEEADPEAGKRFLAGKKRAAPKAPAPAATQPPAPVARQPQAPEQGYSDQHLKVEIAGMMNVLRSTFRTPEALQKVVSDIEAEVRTQIDSLKKLGVAAPPQVISNVYREAQGTVLGRQAQPEKRPAPPRTVRPASGAAPQPKQSADQAFEAHLAR